MLIVIILSLLLLLTFSVVFYSINEKFKQNDPMILKIKKLCEPLHPDVKNIPMYKSNKSYTINKKKIYLCLTDKNNEYYPLNQLVYVFIHELAHYLNKDDVGHTEKFYEIFQELLEKANDLGIYNASIPPIDNYCM